jgi:hypothetical protein
VHKQQRPAAASAAADGMKLHYRRVRLDGREYTVVTPRPGTDVRFATNRYHETWHVLSDWHGARLLGRLLWGLAYQRRPGTLVLIGAPFLDPNPFDGEGSRPIALVPSALTSLRAPAVRQLQRLASASQARPGDGTVRWQTPGLDEAVADQEARQELSRAGLWHLLDRPWRPPAEREVGVRMIGGLLTVAGRPEALRDVAVDVFMLGAWARRGMDYTQIGPWLYDGEVQVFADYRRRVSAARQARAEVLAEIAAEPEPRASAVASAGGVEPLVWDRGTEIRRRMIGPVPAASR